jgi:8-oxo-dGTP pyrophosphatase MutT (NUDIX family)
MSEREMAAVTARPSATAAIVREGSCNPELLMVKRRAGDAFGDSYAFPGGVLDGNEALGRIYCQGKTADEADKALGVAEGGLDFYSAAIRELFEETGILLARDHSGRWALRNDSDAQQEFEKLRKQIDQGSLPWAEFLRERKLRMACDALHYFAHWETPLSEAKRWSARFFLAEMPSNQDVRHDGSELTDSRWLSASETLSIARTGGMKLPFPTLRILRALSEFTSVAALFDWAYARTREGIERIRPMKIELNGKPKFVIPGDPDYPRSGEA